MNKIKVIRRDSKLREGLTQYIEYEEGFFGECLGVVLTRIQPDNRVGFAIVVEDDDNWFLWPSGQVSTAWMPELLEILDDTKKWLENQVALSRMTKDGLGYTFKAHKKESEETEYDITK